MCYDSLLNGEATERSLGDLLRAELKEALGTGALGGLFVLAVLFVQGMAGPALMVGLALAAVPLGAALQLGVFTLGVAALRLAREGQLRACAPA
jgi:hypothetical protein